ncbi:PH and SEC7 domain-containing protein 4 [Octodon degus]|uniref:PH and SEC7 domain-containing protein 4 n=1 Tax=Octodon degus TaxID=10160 RepID=A0A6P6EM70_OCTDE|nr:PH and SEC7 domain-containing protein 4 [Octodon degus]XP_023573161.1 PH and SEC7 domain-containing protein 4 [Octodon degus]XP_023573163.1 PH and SEC7 domain-containing protein 4 [Octodon degus]XP_023573164.1 PH and SEC7 domain-containing protein 4 [Octodon degus]XP_023573165.1 PH and SEC7 domain-containing protein 4 [Octodon degus]XP_023573166.1 PH and SEC7 domain-containing protein 4 [Octodon degus]XP_023573167.1 PH and SEC7 domain-containing protein 4 [Octodon degus]
MMDDDRLSDLQPMEFHNACLGASPQHHPGAYLREPGHSSGKEHNWTFEPPEPSRPDTPPRGSGQEPAHLGSCSSQGDLRPAAAWPEAQGNRCSPGSPSQNQGSSTQVVFWAGILQAQMCVLDLEEELEKTEGLRSRLRCCLPTSTADLPGDTGLRPSTTQEEEEEDCGEDSSGPKGENHAWPREDSPGSSPEWGPEEESLFFDNPLFLESPCSDTSVSREYFSWGFPNSQADTRPGPDWSLPGNSRLWEPESELDLGDSTAGSSGCATPPFPVPPYKSHPFCWALLAPAEDSQVPPPAEEEDKAPLEDECGPASLAGLRGDKTWAKETVRLESDRSPATHPAPPWVLTSAEGWQTEETPSWSPDRGERDDGRPQEAAPRTLAPSPCGSPASSPGSPVSEGRGPGPRPTTVSSQEGSPQPQRHSPGIVPKWPLDASHPSLLETDGLHPTSLKKDEAGEAPDAGQEVECEGPAGTTGAAGAQPDVHWTCAEGPAESPMPQAGPPEEDQRSLAGDELANGVRSDKVAWNLASRLYHLDGFRKSEVAAYLQKNNDFSRAVAEEYLSFFRFGGQSLDCALRSFLQALVLSGETQERERILYQFSRRFYHCNPEAFPSVDSVHTLTCAIMLLNTDLHGQNIGKSMSCQEFITNLNGLQDGGNFPKELLKALYWSIRSEKLEWVMDEEEAVRPEKARPSPPTGKMSNPFLQLAQDPTVPTYKQGILARKMHHDADGKKTPWGKRSWKMFHTLLRGMVLYFLKGEDHCAEAESLVGQMVDEPIGVHHALATQATHYTKKPHVFQLRTADWRLYLFQAPTAKEMTSWIARINLAAATHSAPPFPAAVGSQRRFVRPILPIGPAQNSLEEQHRSHENCLDAASDDLLDLQRNLPERRGRSRELEEYRLRKEYLEYEKARYETYVQLLVARLHCASEDLDVWEEWLGREAEDTWEPKPSLKKSHSSPSLHQDEAPTTAKVKRNISERRTYRKIIPKRNRNQL